MQQPLAHLYFLTIFEDIQQSNYSLSALCNAAHSIRKVCTYWCIYVRRYVCACVLGPDLELLNYSESSRLDSKQVNSTCAAAIDHT